MTIERLRDCEPVPHDFVHADHAPNADTVQWTTHACSLHERASRRFGHSTPPYWTAVVMERVRCCEPAPHDFVHVLHALYVDTTQSTGHLCASLQLRVSSRYGHT